MRVPFLDLKRQYKQIADELKQPMQEVIDSCAFAGGPFTEKFETAFAKFCGAEHAIGLNSGTSALHLAMLALGVGPGDEVILPANTFIATAWGPSYVGAKPVFVDCDEYWNIAVDKIESAITSKTKAVIGVHLYGQPCDIDAIKKLCKAHNIAFVEDAAQAHGAMYRGKPVGGLGDLACFSFYPGKNLGAYGEGGAITTNNAKYRDHLHRLRNHGSDERYYHLELGFNMRMDGIQAAVLNVKLNHLNTWNQKRRSVAKFYLDNITNEVITLPILNTDSESVFHLFVVTVEDRDDFRSYLNDKKIDIGLHYPVPCHLQKVYQDLGYTKGDFPKSEYLADHCVSLPMFAELSQQEIDHVVSVINSY
ncbi:MAG: DegT/DnrJ/EryC1/StrS family aminotransferase [Saprospiraceae bacterium]|nr:DegT/DnrJ/EryC1/StrS family aminotransferase [Saprospiraceae bacterium]